MAGAGATLGALAATMYKLALVVNPPLPVPNVTGRQWVEANLQNQNKCRANFRMSPASLLQLHEILVNHHGLRGTQQTRSIEALARFVWTCAHNEACRQSRDRFARSLDTISRKMSHVADVMHRFANTILVPKDQTYITVHQDLILCAPGLDTICTLL